MSLDSLFTRQRSENYDCLDLLNEAWFIETGEDLSFRLPILFEKNRRVVGHFTRLKEPCEPCVVVMKGNMPDVHVGMFVRNRVFHLGRRQPEYVELEVASRGFSKVRFYR